MSADQNGASSALESGSQQDHPDVTTSRTHKPSHVSVEADNGTTPRKRQKFAGAIRGSRKGYLSAKVQYSDGYRTLLNEVIDEARGSSYSQDEENLPASQIGLVKWSPEEKSRFFTALDRLGRHDYEGIAKRVGTKSALEVLEYVQLLAQATAEEHLAKTKNGLLAETDLPAAVEIEANVEERLAKAAAALRYFEDLHEERSHSDQTKGMWKINCDAAKMLTDDLNWEEDSDENDRARDDVKEALRVLRLENMLKLSENLFMNSRNEEDNWRSYANEDDGPSITRNAFVDLFNLVVQLLQRLVPSITFLAQSRIRSMRSAGYMAKPAVRRQDVSAALDVLGVPANSEGFWVKTARKCNVNVIQTATRSKRKHFTSEHNMDLQGESVDSTTTQGAESMRPGKGIETHLDDSRDEDMTHSEPSSHSSDTSNSNSDGDPDEADEAVEAFDLQASIAEEARLEILLDSRTLPDEDQKQQSQKKRSTRKRKAQEDLIDWRTHIRYTPQWDRYQTPILHSSSACNSPVSEAFGSAAGVSRIRLNTDHTSDIECRQGTLNALSSDDGLQHAMQAVHIDQLSSRD